jgi:hypothetical protein
MSNEELCPLCQEVNASKTSISDDFNDYYRCAKCGQWAVELNTQGFFEESVKDKGNRAKIRNYVFNLGQPRGAKVHALVQEELAGILKSQLASIDEQAERIIYYLGQKTTPGEITNFNSKEIYRQTGSVSPETIDLLMHELVEKRHITGSESMGGHFMNVSLTVAGWRYFEQLQQQHDNKKAFMAMRFAENLSEFFEATKQAVKDTDFELFRLDDDEAVRTGSIDDRLKVSIRASRFMIADLTYENLGVYWEAGYAEGLGKKVILTCREDYFNKVHFDKNHDFIIKWSPETIQEALKVLKAVIRNEFFDEVRKDNILSF